jgi:cytochrome c oxidase assembly factor CtaG
MQTPEPAPRQPKKPDVIGWVSLLVVVPFLWLGAPLVLLVNGVRVWRRLRAGEEVPSPTMMALAASLLICCFWLYYVARLLAGDSP